MTAGKQASAVVNESLQTIKVANAPVSFGVFELSTGAAGLPSADEVAKAVADSGYEGIDLGPPGWLGRGNVLRRRLSQAHLDLAGGWVELRFADDEGFRQDLELLEDCLDLFAAGSADHRAWLPKPTLADAGSPQRKANPGRGKDRPEIGLDDDGWKRLAQRVAEAAGRCEERGLEPTFHHHACTYVEAPHEIERFLELTDVGLCLDSGHLLLGGGDPVQAYADWGDRINHLHVKDARLDVLDRVVREGLGMEAVWNQGAFCELGQGDAGVDDFLSAVKDSGYSGWLVVEQDRFPTADDSFAEIARAQTRNRERLCRYGL
ncbi:MAG: sugar phosphate isomerase/epimerase [Actinomycetota bacterium]|nr:sugar phosphate isomerase/epimerase [Actinomycetota bacterium]